MPLSVLFVDEATPFAERVCQSIGRVEGLELGVRAGTPAEALAALRESQAGLVLVDLGVLQEAGLAVIEKAQAQRPRPVIVVLTAGIDLSTRRLCVAAGADHFFTKMRPLEELEQLLHRIVRTERSRPGSGAWALRAG